MGVGWGWGGISQPIEIETLAEIEQMVNDKWMVLTYCMFISTVQTDCIFNHPLCVCVCVCLCVCVCKYRIEDGSCIRVHFF